MSKKFSDFQMVLSQKAAFGFGLRLQNRITDACLRKDPYFDELTRYYYFETKKFNAIKRVVSAWRGSIPCESYFSLAGYIAYIEGRYRTARENFFKSVVLDPDNLDNWMDIAFALRHCRESKTAEGILFHSDYVIHYFKQLRAEEQSITCLKRLVAEIVRHAP